MMVIWMLPLWVALLVLIADALGVIDMSARPVTRVFKWVMVACWALFLPTLVQKLFKLKFEPGMLDLWKNLVLAVLLLWIIAALIVWLWRHYGPVQEGCRRCPHCRVPVLKLMLECPECRKSLNS